eukprot:763419-Hanusia_phi.AAC.3
MVQLFDVSVLGNVTGNATKFERKGVVSGRTEKLARDTDSVPAKKNPVLVRCSMDFSLKALACVSRRLRELCRTAQALAISSSPTRVLALSSLVLLVKDTMILASCALVLISSLLV